MTCGTSVGSVEKRDPRARRGLSAARAEQERRLLGKNLQLMRGDRLGAGGLHVDRDVNYLHHSTHVAVVVDNLLAGVKARVAYADDLRAYLSLLRVRHDRAQEVRSDPAYENRGHVIAAGNELVLGELDAGLLGDLNVGVVIQVAVAVKIAPAHGNRRCVDRSFGHVLLLKGVVTYDFSDFFEIVTEGRYAVLGPTR